jgi:hypothetical protein
MSVKECKDLRGKGLLALNPLPPGQRAPSLQPPIFYLLYEGVEKSDASRAFYFLEPNG